MDIRDLLRRMEGEGIIAEGDRLDKDMEAVTATVATLHQLEGLRFGDRLRGVKHGEDYVSRNKDKPVIFLRYLTEAEKVKVNMPDATGQMAGDSDIIIAYLVDKGDGDLVRFVVDSSFYEKMV